MKSETHLNHDITNNYDFVCYKFVLSSRNN